MATTLRPRWGTRKVGTTPPHVVRMAQILGGTTPVAAQRQIEATDALMERMLDAAHRDPVARGWLRLRLTRWLAILDGDAAQVSVLDLLMPKVEADTAEDRARHLFLVSGDRDQYRRALAAEIQQSTRVLAALEGA